MQRYTAEILKFFFLAKSSKINGIVIESLLSLQPDVLCGLTKVSSTLATMVKVQFLRNENKESNTFYGELLSFV